MRQLWMIRLAFSYLFVRVNHAACPSQPETQVCVPFSEIKGSPEGSVSAEALNVVRSKSTLLQSSYYVRRHKYVWGVGTLITLFLCPVVQASDLDLTAYRGKVVYVDFWASWCAPCRQSFPWLDSLVREYASQNFVVIGVNVDKDRDRAERFLNETPANFPIVYDPMGELAKAYKLAGMPSGVLIDRTGHIRFQHAGFSEKQKGLYEEQLQALLAENTH